MCIHLYVYVHKMLYKMYIFRKRKIEYWEKGGIEEARQKRRRVGLTDTVPTS